MPEERYPLPIPHPLSEPVRCPHVNPANDIPCNNVVGVQYPPFFHSRRKGRTIHCLLPVRIECESCGGTLNIDEAGEIFIDPVLSRVQIEAGLLAANGARELGGGHARQEMEAVAETAQGL